MGCFQSREKQNFKDYQDERQENNSPNQKQKEEGTLTASGIDFQQDGQKVFESQPEAPEMTITNEPSISMDESDDNQFDNQMISFDNLIFERRKFLLNKEIKPKKIHKIIKKFESPKLEQKNKLDHSIDIKPFYSQKAIYLTKNMQYYKKYQLINKNRIKNYKKEYEENIEQSINDQIITQQINNPQSRKSSISCSSILQEYTFICFSCQKQIQSTIHQLDCLHQFHQSCLYQLIIQQINQKKLQINCLCQKVIQTKIIRNFLEQSDFNDENNQSMMHLENYFQNQYNFLASQDQSIFNHIQ